MNIFKFWLEEHKASKKRREERNSKMPKIYKYAATGDYEIIRNIAEIAISARAYGFNEDADYFIAEFERLTALHDPS